MGDFCDPETPFSTSCPHCGHASTVESTDSLSPQVCSHCQQIHVATLNTTDANESQESQGPVPDATEVGVSLPARTYLGKIGRYRVTKVLGTGAFGVVYQAWDPRLHRWVAIKVPKLAQRRQVVEDFLREARTAARLRHPRIVSVYDAETANGRPFIVVEFVEGSTLATQLLKGAISPRRAARIIYELAMALNYAHQEGIVHRDIKPANIMIDDRGMPRLMDFGLAQLSANQATLGGVIAGTPAYLAPEVARREPQAGGHASDQYSLGIVFYECLVGRRPFEPFQGNLFDLLRLVATQAPARLQSVNADVPDELDHICGKMTTLTAEERYSDLGAVARQLALYLKPVTDANMSAVTATNTNSKLVRVSIGVAVSAIAILLITILVRSGPSPSTTEIAPDPDSSNTPESVAATPAIVASTPGSLPKPLAAESNLTNVDRTAIASPGIVGQALNSDAEVPADALMAVAVIQEQQPPPEVEAKPELVDLKPSFPPLILEADSDRPAFLVEWQALMKTGFNRLDDKAFEKVLPHVKKLRQLAPREPRVPYALAIIRIRYVPSKAVDVAQLPVALKLLREAQHIGGYPFTPAYLSEVDLALSGKIEPLRDALSETANSITQVAAWPDLAERLRVARWLGGPFAYYGSGISGSIANDLQIRKLQDDVEVRLAKNLQNAFLGSILETQAEFGMVDAALEKRFGDAKAENDDRIKQKLLKIAMDREAASKKIETQQLDDQGVDNEFKAKAAVLQTEFNVLQQAVAQLMLSHQPIVQKIALVQGNIARSMMTSKLNPDPTATGAGLADSAGRAGGVGPASGGGGAAARLELQQLFLQLAVVNSQIDRCRIELAVLQEKAFHLERDYTRKKGKSLDTLSKLSRELKSLDQQTKATATTKATKLPDDVLRNRRIVKSVRNWVQWSVNDAREWLSSSIEQAEN